MGLLDRLFPATPNWRGGSTPNPFVNLWDDNRNSIGSAFGGLVGAANPHDAIAGFTQGLNDPNATVADQARQQALLQQQQASLAAKQQQDQQNATIAYLKSKGRDDLIAAINGGMPVAEAWKNALDNGSAGADPADVATYKFYANDEMKAGRKPKPFADWYAGSKMATKAGLGPPLQFRDKAGNWHPVEPMTDGSLIDTMTGKPPAPDLIYDPTGYAGTRARETATGTAIGTTLGGKATDAPKAELQVQQANELADKVLGDTAGMEETFGNVGGIFPQQWSPVVWPGSKKADFLNNVNELINKSWLTVRQDLKGAGQVTDYEGAKAEAAVSRMGNAIKSGSQTDFVQAVQDYKAAVAAGYAIIAQQAAEAGGPIGSPPAAPDAGVVDYSTYFGTP